MIIATVNDSQLDRKIIEFAAFTNRTTRDVGEQVIKGLIRDVIDITPPARGKANKAAQRAGEAAIVRDLGRMGFVPVELKGEKKYEHSFWGHALKAPLVIKTKPNPRFADPDAHHAARLRSRHSGRVTRGGKQAFYVSKPKFNAMRARLFGEVGKLAAGWIPAALRLGVKVPSWISRHGSGNAETVEGNGRIDISYENGIKIRAVNYFPDTAVAEAATTQARVEYAKRRAVDKLTRQLDHLIKKGWKKS